MYAFSCKHRLARVWRSGVWTLCWLFFTGRSFVRDKVATRGRAVGSLTRECGADVRGVSCCVRVWSEGDLGALLVNETLTLASGHVPVGIERVPDECDEPIACVAGSSSRRIGVVK